MSFLRSGVALLIAGALAACSGGLIPPGSGSSRPTPPPPVARPSKSKPESEPAAKPVTAKPRPTLPSTPVVADTPEIDTAAELGVVKGPPIDDVLKSGERSRRALQAFRISCPSLVRRTDLSGLTRGADWQQACSAASSWPDATATEFFVRYFEAVQVGDGKTLATGYYEPEIAGSRTRRAGYDVAVYRRPPELIDVNLGQFSDDLKGKTIRGKVQGSNFVPFDERSDIVAGSLAGRGLEIAWAADPAEFFFLQVQGSGRLKQPDGSVIRIGYDGQNGRDYTGIGRLLKDRGLVKAGSMQEIVAWIHANPRDGAAVMNENKSFVFFKELTGAGPLGALGLPVTPEATVAADPKYVPLGAPVLLSLDRAEPNGIWIAQDTGGAIKGANRFDTFWGAGDRARSIAGGMAARGSTLLLLPVGTYVRLTSGNGRTTPVP